MTAEWSPTGQLSACCGPTVKIWTPGAQDGSRERKINEGTPVYAVDWSTNNKVLAVAGDKAQVSMYSGSTVIGQVPTVVNPHIDTITCMRFSHSSKKMVIGCKNRTMHILDLRQQVGNPAALQAAAHPP
jgi:WD40 repeat protein